jgi:hypothetical protein
MYLPTFTEEMGFRDFVRQQVSGKRIRWKDGEFDLDLTYITNQIIAMGFPADGVEATYRNHIGETDAASELKACLMPLRSAVSLPAPGRRRRQVPAAAPPRKLSGLQPDEA